MRALLCWLGLHWWDYPPTVYPEPIERTCRWCGRRQEMNASSAWRNR